MKKKTFITLGLLFVLGMAAGYAGKVYSKDSAPIGSERCKDGIVWVKTLTNCIDSPTCPGEAWTPKYNYRTGRKIRCDKEGIKKENMVNGIMDAIKDGDCEALDKILQEGGIDIMYERIDGFKGSLYFYMLDSKHNAQCLDKVMPYHPDLEMVSQEYYSKGETPLLFAAKNNADNAVKLLIDAGADVNAKAPDGYTALHHAVRFDNVQMAKYLVAAGADMDAVNDEGWQPFDRCKERFFFQKICAAMLEKRTK